MLLSQLVAGLSIGSVLLLVAIGLSLTFGQMGVINMAHGEFIMVGAYTAFVVQKFVAGAGLSLLISLPLAFVIGGALGVLLEQFLLRHMYNRPLDTLLVTFGVGLILQRIARDIFGPRAVDVRTPEWLRGNFEVLGVLV
ncbi:urea ABC transporter permease subunit UrtB, partial [Acinetobacter baumannii]|nr:urea ABC transporter permease subunit UrtB [Acinetobacter baumannii]